MRKILVYTSPGSDVLRAKALPVSGINGSVHKLIDEMAQVMEKAGGIGIAAPQVGESLQIAIVDIPKDAGGAGRVFLINPRILAAYGVESAPEGCLSLPGIEVPVTRYREITVETLDMENRVVQYKCAGILARAIQHEMDHLKGILIIDKARMLKRFLLKRRIKQGVRNSIVQSTQIYENMPRSGVPSAKSQYTINKLQTNYKSK